METTAKVTPEVLLWARETAGMSLEEAALKLNRKKVSAEVLGQWERGGHAPTYTQLEMLAKIYRRPVAVFFFPSPPQETDIKEKFRSLPEAYAEDIPREIRFLVRDGLVMQRNLYELLDGTNPAERKILKDMEHRRQVSAADLAALTRDYVGISLETQMRWKDSDTALEMWREALEACGLWIFKDAFRVQDYCGFCLHDVQFPIIYLNNSMPKARQIFTLFHELAHLLRGNGGVDMWATPELTGPYEQEEVFCNAFAGAFLVPDRSFREYMMEDPSEDDIANPAKEYKVSREVILCKFYNNHLVSQSEYETQVGNWRKSHFRKQPSGGDYYANRRTYLGRKYLEIVYGQYHRQKIGERELADYLGVKIKSLDTFESYVRQRGTHG